MRQSSIIFGALFVAFIVFVTVRGELPAYIAALLPRSSGGAGSAAPSGGGLLGSIGSAFGGLFGGSSGSSSGALSVESLNPGGLGG